jgi:uncharacterized repeat protein (TIGR01451 family)
MFSLMELKNINSNKRARGNSSRLLWQVCCLWLLLLVMGTSAAAAGLQPDLSVRLESESDASYLGEGVFETSALVQSKSQPAFAGTAALFRVLLKNAGDAPDSFLLKGTGSGSGFTVQYLDDGGVDRSPAFSASGYASGVLAPGQSLTIRVQVTPTVITPGASFRAVVSAASVADASKSDQVKLEAVACSSTAAVTVSTPVDGAGSPGSVVNYPYTVTNVGSGVNTFTLAVADGGWPAVIYADDGAGGGIAGDGVRQSGENRQTVTTGPLAPGTVYRFFVAVSIPQASVDGTRADTHLSVTGEAASAADQVTTTALAAVISVAESVRNLTQGGPFAATCSAYPGDTLEYRMTITNSGSTAAASVGIDSVLPQNTTCLPGSLWVGTSSGGDGNPCEAAQCGWVRESAGSIVARLGQGATETGGGTLAPGKTLYLYFRVQVQ